MHKNKNIHQKLEIFEIDIIYKICLKKVKRGTSRISRWYDVNILENLKIPTREKGNFLKISFVDPVSIGEKQTGQTWK